ncbi:hypothetical protein AALF16_16750 [Bacillus cereus]|uniref:hypothetical protein n=1 Tax=Bacillus cereus TaxID=1396 RepID=UPI00356C15F6
MRRKLKLLLLGTTLVSTLMFGIATISYSTQTFNRGDTPAPANDLVQYANRGDTPVPERPDVLYNDKI